MNRKKIIVIVVAVVLVLVILAKSKKTDGDDTTGTNTGGSSSGNSTGGTSTDKDDYWARGNGDGKKQKDAGETLDQSKVYLSDAQVKSIAQQMHKMYDWTFSDSEFDEMLVLVKNYIFTRADIFAVLNSDSYVYKRWYSWIVNDPNKQRLARMNQVLKSNGVDYQFERGKY